MKYEEALDLLRRAMDLDPAYANPAAQRARALVMQVLEDLEGL
jgi:hypothetical protein